MKLTPKYKTLENTRKESKKGSLPSASKPLVSTVLAVISVLGTVCALLGYGASMSVNTVFDMPHELVAASSFEMLEMSLWVVLQFFENVKPWSSFGELYLAGMDAWPLPLFFFFSWAGVVLLVRHQKKSVRLQQWGRTAFRWLKISSRGESTSLMMLKGGVYSILFYLFMPVPSVLLLMVVGTGSALNALVPMVGMQAGQRHIEKYVIAPVACVAPKTRVQYLEPKEREKVEGKSEGEKEQKPRASCVSIEVAGRPAAKGRVVFATSSAIVLYDPVTGSVERVPTRDARVTSIGEL